MTKVFPALIFALIFLIVPVLILSCGPQTDDMTNPGSLPLGSDPLDPEPQKQLAPKIKSIEVDREFIAKGDSFILTFEFSDPNGDIEAICKSMDFCVDGDSMFDDTIMCEITEDFSGLKEGKHSIYVDADTSFDFYSGLIDANYSGIVLYVPKIQLIDSLGNQSEIAEKLIAVQY